MICSVESSDQDVMLRIDIHPDAIVFKRAQRAVLRACVCGKCGYVEFFVDGPDSLYGAYLESQK